MNFEPQKLFIGLMDFFSILLPGAILTYLLHVEVGPMVLGSRYQLLTGASGWAAFLGASYLSGHVIFLLSSWLDVFYDWVRSYTLNGQISLLARKGVLLPWIVRVLIWGVFKDESNAAVKRAGVIKENALKPLQAEKAINTFQWCKALLTIESPASLTAIQRFEADSKFFRSLVVVLLAAFLSWPFLPKEALPESGSILLAVAWAILLFLSLWRYFDQRFKATNQAYWSVITLAARNKESLPPDEPKSAADDPTHAGGVVMRRRGGRVEYLLVRAKRNASQWVLPKGHIERGENPRETAIREVREETGVWATITKGDLQRSIYSADGREVSVQFFRMEYAGRGLQKDSKRQHCWMTFDKAHTCASHEDTRRQLEAAEQLRKAPAPQ